MQHPFLNEYRWWIKNDDQWLYLLARVHVEELEASGASVAYFWPHPYTGRWEHSDLGWVNQAGEVMDVYGWDETKWYEDTLASPPRESNIKGAASKSATYYWFEFKKALNSNDGYDWSWNPGETVGTEGDLLIGFANDTIHTFFTGYIVLHLGSPQGNNVDPTVYDKFDNPVYDGKRNDSLWVSFTDNGTGQIFQKAGMLVLSRDPRSNGKIGELGGIGVSTRKYQTKIEQNSFFEAKLKDEKPQQGGMFVNIAYFPSSGQHVSGCTLGYGVGNQTNFGCYFDGKGKNLFRTQVRQADFGIWHTARIEVNAVTMEQTYFLDGQVVGSYVPDNADELKQAEVHLDIGVSSEFDGPVTGYADDVRIGRLEQSAQGASPLGEKPALRQQCRPGVLFCDNFEGGRGDSGWDLQPGWSIVQDGANHVLSGSRHDWAFLNDKEWDNHRARFRLKLLQGTIHLVYRRTLDFSSSQIWHDVRYYVEFQTSGLTLIKQVRKDFFTLTTSPASYSLSHWYDVEIAGWQGRIRVYVDGHLAPILFK